MRFAAFQGSFWLFYVYANDPQEALVKAKLQNPEVTHVENVPGEPINEPLADAA